MLKTIRACKKYKKQKKIVINPAIRTNYYLCNARDKNDNNDKTEYSVFGRS